MSTCFLKSDAVEVFPSGYRSDDYAKSRAMAEENLTNLTKFTEDKYRNFAFQQSVDRIMVSLSGYRFSISIQELYNTLIRTNEYLGNNESNKWSCYLYIKFANISEELIAEYGNVLANLSSDAANQIEQLDDIEGTDSLFYGLGVTLDINDLKAGSSYINLEFETNLNSNLHTLVTKFLSISSYNIRNSDLGYNLNEQFDTYNLKLNHSDNMPRTSTWINSVNAGSDSAVINIGTDVDETVGKLASSKTVGKLGFSKSGEILISGESDGESAIRLSKIGDDTSVSAGLTGPGDKAEHTSAKIIYRISDKTEAYLTLPKEPNYSEFTDTEIEDNELVWIKSVDSRKNSWKSFKKIELDLRKDVSDAIVSANNKIGDELTTAKKGIDEYLADAFYANATDAEINDIKKTYEKGIYKTISDKIANIDTELDDAFSKLSSDLTDSINTSLNSKYKEISDKVTSDTSTTQSDVNAKIDEINKLSSEIKQEIQSVNTAKSDMENAVTAAIDKLDTAVSEAQSAVTISISIIDEKSTELTNQVNAAITNMQSTTDTTLSSATEDMSYATYEMQTEVRQAISSLTAILNDIRGMQIAFIKKAYPVGSVFMSAYDSDPNVQLDVLSDEDLEPMEWMKLSPNYYLRSANVDGLNISYTGSSKITLTPDKLPKHRHPEIYAGDSGEYGDWIVLRNESEVAAAKSTEKTKDTLNFSENVHTGYTDDVSRRFDKSYNAGHKYCHPEYRTPRRLYTGPNIGYKSDAVDIANNPLAANLNIWIRVK